MLHFTVPSFSSIHVRAQPGTSTVVLACTKSEGRVLTWLKRQRDLARTLDAKRAVINVSRDLDGRVTEPLEIAVGDTRTITPPSHAALARPSRNDPIFLPPTADPTGCCVLRRRLASVSIRARRSAKSENLTGSRAARSGTSSFYVQPSNGRHPLAAALLDKDEQPLRLARRHATGCFGGSDLGYCNA